MKIDWGKKLTSRKWWFAVTAFALGVYVLITAGCTAETISGAIMSLGAVVAYTVGEGLVDAAYKENKDDT